MRGHNICFRREIRKIIFKLSSKLHLIWSCVQIILVCEEETRISCYLVCHCQGKASGKRLYVCQGNAKEFCIAQENWERTRRSLGINPIALRKAKIVCKFGLSECSRVKEFMTKAVFMKCTIFCPRGKDILSGKIIHA